MEPACAWCRKPGAVKKVALEGDNSVEGYRYFCNTQHVTNWENSEPQPSPPRPLGDMKTWSFFEILKEANLEGWMLLNIMQLGWQGAPATWRINLQKRDANGATHITFTDYAESTSVREAMLSSLANCRERAKHGPNARQRILEAKAVESGPISAALEKRLIKALDNMWAAVKLSAPRS